MKKLISALAVISALALVSLGLFSCEDSSSGGGDSKSSNDLSSLDTSGGKGKKDGDKYSFDSDKGTYDFMPNGSADLAFDGISFDVSGGGKWTFTSKSKVVLYSGTYTGNEAAETGELTLTILKASKDGKSYSLVESKSFIFKITKNGFSAKIPAVTVKAESSSGSGSGSGSGSSGGSGSGSSGGNSGSGSGTGSANGTSGGNGSGAGAGSAGGTSGAAGSSSGSSSGSSGGNSGSGTSGSSSSGAGSSGGSTTPAEKSVTLLPRQGWFNAEKAGVEASVITKVTFMKEAYTGASSKNWDAGVTAGEITAYLNGTEVIVSGNGNKIKANADSSYMFSRWDGYEGYDDEKLGKGFRTLSEIAGLKNLDTSDVTNMAYMFYSHGYEQKSFDISGFNTSKVTNMEEMFGCVNVKTLDLSNFDTSNVTNMERMFVEASFEKLILTSFDTSKVESMVRMFCCCNVESLDLSSFDTRSVRTDIIGFESGYGAYTKYGMFNMFFDNSALKTIYVSEKFVAPNVTINDIPESSKGYHKCGNSSMTDDELLKIYTAMFRECTNLVGGAGTKWSEDHTDASYARIDGEPSNPGYFTKK